MEDLVWKKKSAKVYKYLMLFFIRFAEVLAASIAPSIIGLIILIINPERQMMQFMQIIAFVVFAVMNWMFWVKYKKNRVGRFEFYLMNGITYALYIVISFLALSASDAYMYTIMFSCMRAFEAFSEAVTTRASLICGHIVVLILMVICENISHKKYIKLTSDLPDNTVDTDNAEAEYVEAYKANEKVTFLSVDEVNMEFEREIEEASAIINETESKDETLSDILAVTDNIPYDPDNDIDDDDYTSEAYARREMAETANYSSESLWNEDIYRNRQRIEDYDDEDDMPEYEEDDDEGLWDASMHRGRGEGIDSQIDEEETIAYEEDGDDGLWDVSMYRGRGESIESHSEDDNEYLFEDVDDERLWNSEMYKGKGEAVVAGEDIEDFDIGDDEYYDYNYLVDDEEDSEEDFIYHEEYDLEEETYGTGYYEHEEFQDAQFLDEYDEEGDDYDYINVDLEDYDSDSLWGNFTQGE
ncbi:MAG: hypothetical protein PUF08_01520 [Clostridiales bacterium]|nr:hypothetical protein [Clostridiales bacterium]